MRHQPPSRRILRQSSTHRIHRQSSSREGVTSLQPVGPDNPPITWGGLYQQLAFAYTLAIWSLTAARSLIFCAMAELRYSCTAAPTAASFRCSYCSILPLLLPQHPSAAPTAASFRCSLRSFPSLLLLSILLLLLLSILLLLLLSILLLLLLSILLLLLLSILLLLLLSILHCSY
jgi:hypothetical protein